jgi:hypothetical protein
MRGVSQIVLMLLILVIAIFSISVLWLSFYGIFGKTASAGNTSALGNALSSCMSIDSVKDNKVYLRNCGDGIVTNNSLRVYFDNAPVNFSMNPISLVKGEIGNLGLNININNLALGNHKLKITSPSAEVERFVKVVSSNSSGEIIYLKFDEGSGAMAYDSSSYHNDGTLQNIYPLDVIAINPSLEDPWYLINNTDANHITTAPYNWKSDTSFYNISTTTMLGQKETSIVEDGSSAFNMTFKSTGAFSGGFCLLTNDTNNFPINESQYLEGGDFRYIIRGDPTSFCDLSFYFYNNTNQICRRWSNDTYQLNVSVGNGWSMMSYIWLPSSLDPNPPTQGSYTPYIPKGAKYAHFQQYFVYQGSTQDYQTMFDKFFIYQWSSMPTIDQRISRASSGWTDGKFGKALRFDGYNDYINVSDSSFLDVSNFTISFWMFPHNASGYLIDKETWSGGTEYGYEAHFLSGGIFNFLFGDGTSTQKNVTSSNPLFPNTWYYLTGTYDGSTFKIYINGVLNNSVSYSTYPNYTVKPPLYIGADNDGGSYFNGIIDEVRIWNRSLTQAEIQTVMNGGQIATSGTPSLVLGELT